MTLRFHTQTGGATLTAQQPENNIVRTAIQALAAVLGGTQSLHTNSMDEALALPGERAVQIALRTQQIIAYESGVADTVDPLAGSYYLESLTDRIEEEALRYVTEIDGYGGALAAVESGYQQRQIQENSYRMQREVESGRRIIVGVNEFTVEEPQRDAIFKVDPQVEARQLGRLQRVRERRDDARVKHVLARLEDATVDGANTMDHFLECVEAYVTVGEISHTLRKVWGEQKEHLVV